MADDGVRVEWDERELAALARDEYVRRAMAGHGGRVATAARAAAPHRTGAGAGSIRSETVLEDGAWETHVSWDQLHWYMRIHDLGSKHIRGQHFLERALDRYARP